MPITNQVKLDGPRLFPEIEGLDDHILKDLAWVSDGLTTIVICAITLPPGEIFRLSGEQYGIYIITTNKEGNQVVKGVRTERYDGKNGKIIAITTAKAVISAFTAEEPRIVEFKYPTVSTW